MKFDFLQDPEKLATFILEYLRNEGKEDAGVLAVTAADLRHPQYLPHSIAEYLLSSPEIQAAIKAARPSHKPASIKKVSAETISQDMEVIYQRALDDRQYTAAIAAKNTQAKMHGLDSTNININHTYKVEDMSTAKLMEIAARGATETPIEGEFVDVTPKQ